MRFERVIALERVYTGFNAQRTMVDVLQPRLEIHRFGGADALIDTVRPEISHYNRVMGFGEADLQHLDAIVALYEAHKVPLRFDLVPEAFGVAEHLIARGLKPTEVFSYLDADATPRRVSMPVRRIAHDEVDTFLDHLEVQGGAIAPEIRALRRPHYCTETFRTFAIEADGEIVAAATSWVHGAGALLGNANTLEGYRGRGYQQALLAARIDDAAQLGLKWVVTDVEPGTTSERNAERVGMRLCTVVTVWS